MEARKRIRRGPLVLPVIGILAVVSIWFGLGLLRSPSSVVEYVEAGVKTSVVLGDDIALRIPEGSLEDDATVSLRRVTEGEATVSALPGARRTGDVFDVTIGAPLRGSVTLEFKVDAKSVTDANSLFVAFFDPEVGRWWAIPSIYDPHVGVVQVEVYHLSLFGVFDWVTNDVAEWLGEKLDAFLGFSAPQMPECVTTDAVQVVEQRELLACSELNQNESLLTVRISNPRRFGIEVSGPPGSVAVLMTQPSLSEDLTKWAVGLFAPQAAYLPPGATVDFHTPLDGTIDSELIWTAKASDAASLMTAILFMVETALEFLPEGADTAGDVLACVETPEVRDILTHAATGVPDGEFGVNSFLGSLGGCIELADAFPKISPAGFFAGLLRNLVATEQGLLERALGDLFRGHTFTGSVTVDVTGLSSTFPDWEPFVLTSNAMMTSQGGIYLDDTKPEALAFMTGLLGEPSRVEDENQCPQASHMWLEDGFFVGFNDSRLWLIAFSREAAGRVVTDRGLRIGDDAARVSELYPGSAVLHRGTGVTYRLEGALRTFVVDGAVVDLTLLHPECG